LAFSYYAKAKGLPFLFYSVGVALDSFIQQEKAKEKISTLKPHASSSTLTKNGTMKSLISKNGSMKSAGGSNYNLELTPVSVSINQ